MARPIRCALHGSTRHVLTEYLQMVFIWSLETGQCVRQLAGHTDLVRCLRFKDKYLISGSYDK